MSSPFADPAWWQRLPQCLAEGQGAVLVTVARVEGSTPREAGASLLVEARTCTDTLGGGNLEFEAIEAARQLLAGAGGPAMVPYALGPGLRQCCGGAVWLLYERITADARGSRLWARLGQALQRGERVLREWDADGMVSKWRLLAPAERVDTRLDSLPGLRWRQVVGEEGFPLRLFGAGHVGRALARVLAATEARLQWVDPRPECVESATRIGLPLRCASDPLDAVADAPVGCWFVVMTHSHALDFELVEAILRRRDARFCGLIGSATKSARFRHNLRRQGLGAATVAGLTCPLGIEGIHHKAPSSVAIAIAAQILQLREAGQAGVLPLPSRQLQRRPA